MRKCPTCGERTKKAKCKSAQCAGGDLALAVWSGNMERRIVDRELPGSGAVSEHEQRLPVVSCAHLYNLLRVISLSDDAVRTEMR